MQSLGLGPERRKALLQHFGSIENILAADVEEIAQIKGIGVDLAQAIKTQLE
jgi:excinuclease ABC subunit C